MIKENRRIGYLDLMRVFAFLSVLVGHLFNKQLAVIANDQEAHITVRQLAQVLYDVCFSGAAGVMVFFLTSGYIIIHVLQKESAGDFMVRRIFRIYPLFIFAVLTEIIVTYNVMNVPLPTVSEVLWKLTLLGHISSTPYALSGVEWTLRVEVMFYIFMGVAKHFGIIDKPMYLPFVMAVAAIALFVCGPYPNWAGWTNGYLNIFGPFLFIGVLIYLIEKRLANLYLCLFVIFMIYVMCIQNTVALRPELKESNFAILALAVFMGGWLLRNHILTNSLIRNLSEMTYAIYLFHLWSWGYLEIWVSKLGFTIVPYPVQQLIVLLIFSYVVTNTVEKWGISAGRRLVQGYSTKTAQLVVST